MQSLFDNSNGLFLSLEGTDGAGKSTAATRLADRYRDAGVPFLRLDKWYCEPVDPEATQGLRDHMERLNRLIFGRPREVAAQLGDQHWFHMLAAWQWLMNDHVIVPALRRGLVVILDNSPQKTIARYLVNETISAGTILSTYEGLVRAHCTIFLDVDPKVALARKGEFSAVEAGRGTSDSDYLSYQNRVASILRNRCREERWHRIDTSEASAEEVVDAITTLPHIERSLTPVGKALYTHEYS